jgi:hypothetical protein
MAYGLVSPTHKRTEGRAPVWGSEFTSKGAVRKIVGFGDWWWWRATLFLEQPTPILFMSLLGPSKKNSNLRPKYLSREF